MLGPGSWKLHPYSYHFFVRPPISDVAQKWLQVPAAWLTQLPAAWKLCLCPSEEQGAGRSPDGMGTGAGKAAMLWKLCSPHQPGTRLFWPTARRLLAAALDEENKTQVLLTFTGRLCQCKGCSGGTAHSTVHTQLISVLSHISSRFTSCTRRRLPSATSCCSFNETPSTSCLFPGLFQ